MCGKLSRWMLTEVQREAQTSASCYAQLNTSILLHTSSLHHPELRTLLLLHKTNNVQEYPEHGDKKKWRGRVAGCTRELSFAFFASFSLVVKLRNLEEYFI